MEQYYAASDIYQHPTFYDSCSLTVLETLPRGLPVITSRFNGAADVIISNKGGKILEDPGYLKDLAESIAFHFDEARRSEAQLSRGSGWKSIRLLLIEETLARLP